MQTAVLSAKTGEPILMLDNITKEYEGRPALSQVSLSLAKGEIHGLVGENGAGKSTLLGILSGRPDIARTGGYTGDVWWHGRKVVIRNPAQAAQMGIGMVHQEFSLIPTMSVAENVCLGHEHVVSWTSRLLGPKLALIDNRQDRAACANALARFGTRINPDWKVGELSVNWQQLTELAREFGRPALELLILDEPTSALAPRDAVSLMKAVRELADGGTTILFVSHRLEEVTALCDRVTVLRDGRVAARFSRSEFDVPAIAASMVGRIVAKARRQGPERNRATILSLRDYSVDMPGERLERIALDIGQGEIVGLAGMPGQGKLAVGAGIMGLYPCQGELLLAGLPLVRGSDGATDTEAVLSRGVCLVPDDRRQAGLLMNRTVEENIVFTAVQQGRFMYRFRGRSFGWVDRRQSGLCADNLVKRLGIRCTGLGQPVRELSGGNQQKVCIARAMALAPQVLFVHEPTRGVDIGAKEMILDALLGLNGEHGTTIVVASSELGELKRICDRIIIFYEGRISANLGPDSAEAELAMALAGQEEVAE